LIKNGVMRHACYKRKKSFERNKQRKKVRYVILYAFLSYVVSYPLFPIKILLLNNTNDRTDGTKVSHLSDTGPKTDKIRSGRSLLHYEHLVYIRYFLSSTFLDTDPSGSCLILRI
jgi:hypothetical protein